MTSYRFLNADHSLVLRDDHVIAWDAKLNQPFATQPSATPPSAVEPIEPSGAQAVIAPSDELSIWKAAGEPTPQEFLPSRPVAPPPTSAPKPTDEMENIFRSAGLLEQPENMVPWEPGMGTVTVPELDKLTSMRSDSLAGLSAKVDALATVVRALVMKGVRS